MGISKMKILLLTGFFFFHLSFMDAANFWQLGFQDPATPIMEGIVEFHNHLMVFLAAIATFVVWLLFRCLSYYSYHGNVQTSLSYYDENFTHSTVLEVVWTIVPALILMVIAVPSFALLYSMEESIQPSLTLKVVGHQWYWSYEYPEVHQIEELSPESLKISDLPPAEAFYKKINLGGSKQIYYNAATADTLSFDSYMIAEDDLTKGALRLLEVDRRVVLPEKTHIRVLVTSADVLHSWAVPSFGLKLDACPGRLNQTSLFVKRKGLYFGQCSEICGVNHGFMPIVVKVVSKYDFKLWQVGKLMSFDV
jgi:cytochrome c oxidase subunit 2